jgi:uncharacterized protein (UPF0261 family)
MPGYIAVVATMDTKGDQVEYLKDKIEEAGQPTCAIDIGVAADGPFEPTYNRHQVAEAAGTTIQGIFDVKNRRAGLEKMGDGAANIIREMNAKGELGGVIAVGGSQGTAVSLLLMRTVPLGIPKLMLTTVAYSPVVTPEMVGGVDLIMMPWTAGLWGLNSLSRQSLETAAVTIAAAAKEYAKKPKAKKKIVGISSVGGSIQRYVGYLKPELEKRGYEVAVFHALGMQGRMFERAIYDGLIDFSLDLSVGGELVNFLNKGVYSSGEARLEAAGQMKIPQIVSPGTTEVFMWGNDRPLPTRYKNRIVSWHSALHMSISTNAKEMGEVGAHMAKKLNMSKGPTAMVLPLQGIGWAPGSLFGSPERASVLQKGMAAFTKNIKKNLDPKTRYVELDVDFNDRKYLEKVMELFDEMRKQ